MNKSLYAIIAGIVVVGGLIGFTMMNKPDAAHTANDGHTESDHAAAGTAVPHDDTGLAPHQD